MHVFSGISIIVAGLALLLGVGPGWAGPPNNDVSDAGRNTAGGTGALQSNSSFPGPAVDNTAFGFLALTSNTTGDSNTAFGKSALRFNTFGRLNTAVGLAALGNNTMGGGNVAVGTRALLANTSGGFNTAIGAAALQSNTTGDINTAGGDGALFGNTAGIANTANGYAALAINASGGNNTAVGFGALFGSTAGDGNTAVGNLALAFNTSGGSNTAVGLGALNNNATGSNNIAVGNGAGQTLTSGDNNIYLGANSPATESNTMRLGQTQTSTFIAGIVGTPLTGTQLIIRGTGQLGIIASSARYKRSIRAMGVRSRGVYELRPVIFRYRQDPQRVRQYGLIAEDVARVYPELVTRRSDGAVESVQYHELIPMLLNELQRQQCELRELRTQIKRLQSASAEETAAVIRRSGRPVETTHSAPLASR